MPIEDRNRFALKKVMISNVENITATVGDPPFEAAQKQISSPQ